MGTGLDAGVRFGVVAGAGVVVGVVAVDGWPVVVKPGTQADVRISPMTRGANIDLCSMLIEQDLLSLREFLRNLKYGPPLCI